MERPKLDLEKIKRELPTANDYIKKKKKKKTKFDRLDI